MLKLIYPLLLTLLLLPVSACKPGDEIESLKEFQDGKKVWVFAQFNVEQKDNTLEDYYYFGQINASLYRKIAQRKIRRGFIALKKVRYWASDDSVKSYSDELYSDEIIFRVEDIRKIDLLKREPEPGFSYNHEENLSKETSIEKAKD